MNEKTSLLSIVNTVLTSLLIVKMQYLVIGENTDLEKTIYLYEIAQHELLKENADIDFVKKLLNKIRNGEQTESR